MHKTRELFVKQDIHDSVSPAEVRPGESISIFLRVRNSMRLKAAVWRISPIGVEIIIGDSLGLRELNPGENIEMEVCVGNQTSIGRGVVVAGISEELGNEILGIRFCERNLNEWDGLNRRQNRRWLCSEDFLPFGEAKNPAKFQDIIYFRAIDISAAGMSIITSLRNKHLVPGILLLSDMVFPLAGQATVKLRLGTAMIVEVNGKEYLKIGAEFLESPPILSGMIAQYIFQFGPIPTLKLLKEDGLRPLDAPRAIEFKYVRTEDEFQKVLELRHLAYGSENKVSDGTILTDIFDARSRIIIAVSHGEVIASVRLIFSDSDDKMEHDQFVELPPNLPPKEEICEITRVCTHPDFRGASILLALFNFVAITTVQTDRKYILGCATKPLLPMYLRMGFQDTGLTYRHVDLNNEEHTVFIAEVKAGLAGHHVNPIIWNLVWKDVVQYLELNEVSEFSRLDKIRILIYKLFSPAAHLINYWRK